MILHRYQAEADEFVRQYAARPNRRRALVEGLVRAGGRLQLNVPGYGIARLISARLRQGPFSVFYEFEKTLARLLHPLLADLNLNLFSDILVNSVFGVNYSRYARAANRALAAGGALTIDTLRDVIMAMVEDDGHYMVVKFYDLVLRQAVPGLFKKVKPVELSVIEMKHAAGEAAPDRERVNSIVKQFRVHYGDESADMLLRRMAWDAQLRDFVPGDERTVVGPESAGQDEAGGAADGEPGTESIFMPDETPPEPESRPLVYDAEVGQEQGAPSSPWDSMIAKYAVVIKRDFLDKAGDDGDALRQIVEAMFRKNARAFGNEEADEIVRRVLEAWVADGTIAGQRSRLLREVLEERQRAAGEPPENYVEPTVDAIEEDREAEEVPENEAGPLEAGMTDAEMDALTGGLDDGAIEEGEDAEEPVQHDAAAISAAGAAGDDGFDAIALDMEGTAEEFLISGEESPGGAAAVDGGFLIEDRDQADAAATDGTVTTQTESDFVVQDELLFEDKSLGKKSGGGSRKNNV